MPAIAKAKPAAKKRIVVRATPKKVPLLKIRILGRVIHYYDHIGVAIVELAAPIRLGDIIRIKHGAHEHMQPVTSLQIDHQPVNAAKKKDVVGIRTMEKVQEGALVMPL